MPYIITNRYSPVVSPPQEGSLNTMNFLDRDYTIVVRAEDIKGNNAGASDLVNEKSVKVRFDNYKAYIQRIVVSDENSLVKYFARWSNVDIPDGTIFLEERNSEPFKTGTQANVLVTTSEKVPSLKLSAAGQNINMTAVGTSGTDWSAVLNIPSSSNGLLALNFSSGDRIYGLIKNQEQASVIRNFNTGKFSDQASTDKNHELKVCVENSLSLDVSVVNGQSVTLAATGGSGNYSYSIDEMPIPPNHRSVFGSANTFTIQYDKNYLFKVRDDAGCQAEKYYTLEKVPCNALTSAGGEGTDIKQVNLGSTAGNVTVFYEMYTVPDQITLTYRGNVIFNSGIVSGSGSFTFAHTIVAGQNNLLTITMFAPNPGTAWNYRVDCPGAALNRQLIAGTSVKNNFIQMEDGVVKILPKKGEEEWLYNLKYRIVGSEKWVAVPKIKLPYSIKSNGKETEIKLEKTVSEDHSQLNVYPNPANSWANLNFYSNKVSRGILSIINENGVVVKATSKLNQKGINLIKVDINELPQGLYLIKYIVDGRISTGKLVISRP